MNMSVGLNIQNKIKNEINLNFQKKDLNYYQKAIPYLIQKAIQNTPKEAQERLNALLKPEVLALLAITGCALASPAGPIIGTGLTAWGLADLAVSLKTLIEGVINAKNINDLDHAAQTGSKIFIDALTKGAGAIFSLLKSQKKLEALLSLLKKANPGVATKIEKVFLSTNYSHDFTSDKNPIKMLIQMVNNHKNIELAPHSERQQLFYC